MRSRVKGFTLVELLVVIGIIALLISILLPSLARARAQAVLVQDASNMRQVGMALQLYANENKGLLPHGRTGDGDTRNWHWEVTRIMGQDDPSNPRKRATVLYSAGITQQPCVEPFYWWPAWTWNAYDERASYYCNPRLMPQTGDLDFANVLPNQPGRVPVRRQFSDVKDPASKMLIWDGGVVSWNNMSVVFPSPWFLDGWRWFYGHRYCMPAPDDAAWDSDFEQLVAVGGDEGTNNLAQMQILTNVDFGGGHAPNPERQAFWNGMRFRHMNNTTGVFLFVDGHVESRKIGDVRRKDYCVNFK